MSQKSVVRLDIKPGRMAASGDAAAFPIFEQISAPAKSVYVQGARSFREFRRAFDALVEEEARRAFLDTVDRAITTRASDTSSWASLYEAADFLREREEFWKELGFSSFESYWRNRVGEYFSNWHELESAYNYAVIACPELFNVDWNEASQRSQQVARIRQIAPAASHGGVRTHSGQYRTVEDAAARVIEGGDWVHKGGESFEYRVSKIKRDRPDIFDDMVAGKFFKKTQTGVVTIDLKAAEAAAGTNEPRKRPKKEMLGRARQLVSSVKNQLRQAPESQRVFLDELLNLPWVVKALKARGWRKDDL